MATAPSYRTQVIGSLVAAVIIALLAIVLVTAKIGPGLDAKELHDLGRDGGSEQQDEHSGPGR